VQVAWLLWRSALGEIRDPFALRVTVIQTVVIAIVVGLIFLQLNYDQTGIRNLNGIKFFNQSKSI